MWTYLICFGLSAFFIYLSEKKKHKVVKKILATIGIMIPCVIAGARDLKIGTDVLVYLQPMFSYAQSAENFSEFLKYKLTSSRYINNYELGFTLLLYTITSIFNNIHILMFIIELLIILPIYFGCKKIRYLNGKIWLCMLVYYCLFFNVGLNAMREFIGLSFAFYGICSYISEEKNGLKKYLIASVLAFLFHKSTIISIVVIMIYKVQKNTKTNEKYITFNNKKLPITKLLFILIIGTAYYLLFNMEIFNSFLYSMDGFNRYAKYYIGDVYFSINNLIRTLPLIIMMIMLYKNFITKYDKSMFLTSMFIFGWIIFGNLNTASTYGDRISHIFKLMSVVYFPLLSSSPINKNRKDLSTLIIIIYVIVYWWYMFVYKGYNQTIPYIWSL